MRLDAIASKINAELIGDGSFELESLAASPELAGPRDLALVFPGKFSKAAKLLKSCQSLALLVSTQLFQDQEFQNYYKEKSSQGLNFLVVERPKYALMLMNVDFAKARYQPDSIHDTAVIEPGVQLGEGVKVGALSFIAHSSVLGDRTLIYPRVYIGKNVKIGKDCEIHSGAVIEDYSEIGDRVIIQSNSVIGSDGYSYITKDPSNLEKLQKGDFNFNLDRQVQHKVCSAGNVIIEDDVEIGANTCIDRGTIGPTKIGTGTKIDNLCQIAHNVQIGKDCLIIAKTGIAGSAKIGDRVTMAGASGCGDGVEIGHDVVVGAFTAVNSDLDPFLPVLGAPAIPYGEFMKRQRALVRLPKLTEELRKLKSQVQELVQSFERSK